MRFLSFKKYIFVDLCDARNEEDPDIMKGEEMTHAHLRKASEKKSTFCRICTHFCRICPNPDLNRGQPDLQSGALPV